MSDLEKDPIDLAKNENEVETTEAQDVDVVASDELSDPNREIESPSDVNAGLVEGSPAPAEAVSKPSSVALPWIIAVIAIAALVFVLVRNAGGSGGMNEAVGKLDGKSITKSEFYDEMLNQVGKDQAGSMLDSYMLMKLISLEAEKAGATVTDADYAKEITKIKEKYNFATDADLEAALTSSGTTLEKYKEQQLKPQVELRAIFDKQLAPKEADLKAYFDKNKANFATSEQVRASHILVATQAEADAILKELQGGADFAKLAEEKSTDTGSAAKGGDLGFFGKGVMNEQFETAAFKLKKGEMSGVVQSPNGFHIIKVTDKKEAVDPTYDQVKDDVKAAYLDEKVNEGASAWIEKAKKDEGFENLLTKTDEATASPAASAAASPTASANE